MNTPNFLSDEGFTDDDTFHVPSSSELLSKMTSEQECEELAYKLLASLPRSRLATIQRRLAPLLQFDVVGSLPAEVSLHIFSHLSAQTLLTCALVSRRWRALANDQAIWKKLCVAEGWTWKQPSRTHPFDAPRLPYDDDEGMGDSDEEGDIETAKAEWTLMQAELDSGFASMSLSSPRASTLPSTRSKSRTRHNSAPPHSVTLLFCVPITSAFTRRTRASPTAYVLAPPHSVSPRFKPAAARPMRTRQPFIVSSCTPTQQLACRCFSPGRATAPVREWNLATGLVERVIAGVHASSVLSICVHDGLIASAGSDRRVAVWDLAKNELVKIIADHDDSVLCVRLDSHRLVSCSKDRTVRTYAFPDLKPQFVLGAHRAAVNAVSLSDTLIVSGSGDRSVRLWDARTGALLRTFENHHTRGIASIACICSICTVCCSRNEYIGCVPKKACG
ncbi:WD40-repeat-containing domain protein [Mycena crocata]|nr:WD40-repeat-containing domain protein [Mycena crocata]